MIIFLNLNTKAIIYYNFWEHGIWWYPSENANILMKILLLLFILQNL